MRSWVVLKLNRFLEICSSCWSYVLMPSEKSSSDIRIAALIAFVLLFLVALDARAQYRLERQAPPAMWQQDPSYGDGGDTMVEAVLEPPGDRSRQGSRQDSRQESWQGSTVPARLGVGSVVRDAFSGSTMKNETVPGVQIPGKQTNRAVFNTNLLGGTSVARLDNRDVIILVDKSGSMVTKDAISPFDMHGRFRPGFAETVSRWEWCRRQALNLADRMKNLKKARLRLILYDSKLSFHDNITLSGISRLFNEVQPSGGTNTLGAMEKALEAHFYPNGAVHEFSGINRGRKPRRPTVIACITDGEINGKANMRQLIIDASSRIANEHELSISFLQVGSGKDNDRFLRELDNDLTRRGAVLDIVDYRGFTELNSIGLASALEQAAR